MHETSEHFNNIKHLSQPLIKKLSTQPGCQPQNRLLENYYKIALSAFHAGVWSWEPGQDQLYWSENCFEITGLKEGLARLDQILEITHPADKQRLKIMWPRITASEGPFDMEFRIIRYNETRWLKISGNYQKTDSIPNLINGLVFDVTEEKEFKEKLLESRSLFQSVVDDQTELICRFDTNKIMTFSNKAFRKFFHVNSAAKENLQLKSFFEEHDYIRFSRTLKSLSPSRSVMRFFQKHSLLHANFIRVHWTLRGFFNPEGEITGYQFVGRDITEIEKHREALKQSENMFRLIAENSKDIISIHSRSGKLEYVSPSIQGILGYTPAEITGTKSSRMIWPEDRLVLINTALKLRQHAKPQLVEFRIKNADGQRIWFESMIQHEYNKKGITTGRSIAVTRNIQKRKELEQEQKRIEKELIETNLTKDKFFTIIAHDLRSPFTSILGFSRLLNDEYDDFDDEDRKMMVQQIQCSAEATYQLLDNLLAWARTQLGRTSFNPEKFYIESLIEETILQTNAQAISKEITTSFTKTETNVVFADINMTRVVLRNLISNAIKYSNKGSEIKITSRIEDKHIAIGVKDEGVGMEPSVCQSLFNLHSNMVSTKGTDNEKGTGLGLILAKEFVERNGGGISAQSEEGKGSFFEFTIPLFV